MVCRERERITALAPLSLLRENGSQFNEHHYACIDTLQTYWRGGPDLGSKLVAPVDGTDPTAASDPETAGKLLYPPMEMFHRFVRSRLRASSLSPLAMACFGHDAASRSRSSPSTCPPSPSAATGSVSSLRAGRHLLSATI
ncbi:hypothetical protein SSP24_35220 [Streptomyces spinoverrucosus]|uniref:Uncharacterized protein n=1 Tax=Streptomyces spinoverrucosus TaxID=284043 RepID=A0A4Y3VG47_9ACTN|nr:hypothetical protein SSP24_35220 [Streptomyces spinoverrucosus]GHB82161.1 hypothetical protein GCM10010397_61470 [Streptomyces spinoverrucosus]